MTRYIEPVCGGKVEMEYFSDDVSTHYILAGERFRHEHELLKLIAKYEGACTEDSKAHALSINCDFDCMNCDRSIYSIIKKQERFFVNRCVELCKRYPKKDDEWEVSLVSYDGIMPKYQNYFFKCLENITDKTIMELAYEIIHTKYPKFYAQSKYSYIKVRRFDMPTPIDVSLIGNQYFQGLLEEVPFDQIIIKKN